MQKSVVTMFSRSRCPLCDKAKAVLLELLDEFDFVLEEVDIESSDELTERYGLMIPVVHIDGEEVAYGFVDKYELSNRLQERGESK